MSELPKKTVASDLKIWTKALEKTCERALGEAEKNGSFTVEADAELFLNVYAASQVVRGIEHLMGRDWDELKNFEKKFSDDMRIIRNILTHYDNWYVGEGRGQKKGSGVHDIGGVSVQGANVPYDYTRTFLIKEKHESESSVGTSLNYQVGSFSRGLLALVKKATPVE